LLFNSVDFVVFLAVVLALYHLLPHRGQNLMLLGASYLFYGWWDWRFCSLLALSTAVDFLCARGIEASSDRKPRLRLLRVSIVTNLGILGFFKYFDFFTESAVEALAAMGVRASFPLVEVVLPVGISFYTFQSLSYTVDVYRGETRACRRFLDFALFVGFFPQLVAGPIERARHLLPQLERPRRVVVRDWSEGGQLLLLGFFKKLCIADGVAPHVDRAFSDPAALSAPELWLSMYLVAIQIYGDFSGYTDIARGVARLLGIRLAVNFRQPLLSASMAEMWSRWHITLSTWLRDYVYKPLGGSRRGGRRTAVNLLLTMLLGGLWHGAAWHFVVWGGLHGLALVVQRALTGQTVSRPGGGQGARHIAVRILLTFHLWCLLVLVFRADDLPALWAYLAAMMGTLAGLPVGFAWMTGIYLGAVLLIDWPCWRRDTQLPIAESWPAWARGAAYAGLILAVSFVGETNVRPFVYFQF